MKNLLFLLPLLFVFALHATAQTKEEFLNVVAPLFVDSSEHYFYIDENANRIEWSSMNLKAVRKELSPLIKDSVIKQLYYNSLTDTIPEKWDCSLIGRARCVNPDTFSFDLGFFILDIDPKWSEKKQKEERRKQLKEKEKAYAAKPKGEGHVYCFSRPVFDNTKQYAIMRVTFRHGIQGGYGFSRIYLLKKNKEKWEILSMFASWTL